ncbi:MAG: PAS domain S-box protein [Proteobacteria bacterium]|nr:PAS domain S-box protein [Pseudomonadota bacterium]
MSDHDSTKEQLIDALRDARKRIKELEDREAERLRAIAIIESATDLVATATPDGKITYMNPAGRGMLGWENIDSKYVEDGYPELALEQLQETALPCVKRNDAWFGETAILNVDGIEVPVSQVIVAHKSLSGQLEYYSTIVRDITDQRITEEEISTATAYLQSCLLSLPDAVLMLDEKGRFIGVNATFLSWVERGLEDFIGKTLRQVTPPFFSDETLGILTGRIDERIRSGGTVSNIEFDITDLSGRIRNVLYAAAAVLNDREEILGEIVIIRDITALKNYEIDLLESEEKFRMISEQSLIGISIIQEDRVVYVNDQAAMITGYSREDMLSWEPNDLLKNVHPEDLEKLLDEAERSGNGTGEPAIKHFTFRVLDHTGDIRWVDQYSKKIHWGGKPAYLNSSLDITERKRLEEIMIQSEKMLSVGGLAAGMAHEINNPLAGILQATQVIINRLSGDVQKNRNVADTLGTNIETIEKYMGNRKVLTMLDSIQEAGERAADIVENMLSFSRKSDSLVTKNSLADLLDKTVELTSSDYDIKNKFDFRSIEVIRDYEDEMPLVPCKKSEIQQVFLNILRNSAQAMAENHATQEKQRFVLRVTQNKGLARVEIEDNGPGMSEESRKRVFEPFFTTKPIGEGTGLGLSVSYFIITEHHEGTMSVLSTLGHGTKFIIELPINP